jgi:hypothetical protein
MVKHNDHKNCKRDVKRLLQKAGYALYRIKDFHDDGCTKSGVTAEIKTLVEKAEAIIADVRYKIRVGGS